MKTMRFICAGILASMVATGANSCQKEAGRETSGSQAGSGIHVSVGAGQACLQPADLFSSVLHVVCAHPLVVTGHDERTQSRAISRKEERLRKVPRAGTLTS